MNTTLGQLITNLFDKFQTVYGDDKLAALATQKTVSELLEQQRMRTRKTA